jgi:hypothetical protein
MDQPKLKLTFLASRSWSDAEQVLWWLSRGLYELGHQIVWVCPESSKIADEAQALGHTCLALPSNDLQIFARSELNRRLQRIGIDCLIENQVKQRFPILSLWPKRRDDRVEIVLQHSPFANDDGQSCLVRAVSHPASHRNHPSQSLRLGLWPGEHRTKSKTRQACLASLSLPESTRLICAIQGLCYTPDQDEHFHAHLLEAVNNLRWHSDSFCMAILSNEVSIAKSQLLTAGS